MYPTSQPVLLQTDQSLGGCRGHEGGQLVCHQQFVGACSQSKETSGRRNVPKARQQLKSLGTQQAVLTSAELRQGITTCQVSATICAAPKMGFT